MRERSPKNEVILSGWEADELEPEKVAVRLHLGPYDFGMLHGLVVDRGTDSQGADLTDGNARIRCYTEPSDARVDRQTGPTNGTQEIDLGIELPATGLAARTTVDSRIRTAPRKHRRESFGNGHVSGVDHIEVDDP